MTSDDPNASPLAAAAERLTVAIERLEARVAGLLDGIEASEPHRREAEALRRDRAKLAADLDAAKARERELQKLADEASEALGAAINEVREALGKV
ncbi:DUF4164 family protein [bacterium]|nr:DUF4164 family protein [bacterium]